MKVPDTSSIGHITGVIILVILMTGTIARPMSELHHRHNHKRLKKARIQAIKYEILTKLGMDRAPDISTANVTNEEKRRMIKLFKNTLVLSPTEEHVLFREDDFYAQTYHRISAEDNACSPDVTKSKRSMTTTQDSSYRFHFKINVSQPANPHAELHVHSSHMKLYKSHVHPDRLNDRSNPDKTVTISVYQLLEDGSSKPQPLRRLVHSKIISLATTGWETFNIEKTVQDWIDDPTKNFGVQIVCDSQNIRELVQFSSRKNCRKSTTLRNINSVSKPGRVPMLDVYTQEKYIIPRRKRMVEEKHCKRGDGETRCCRYKLWVSFKDIGWDWVVSPDGYEASYCDGQCPHRYKTAHNFSLVKALLHAHNPSAAPSPCCTASKLRPLPLLHYDINKKLVMTQHDDMIVDECKCS